MIDYVICENLSDGHRFAHLLGGQVVGSVIKVGGRSIPMLYIYDLQRQTRTKLDGATVFGTVPFPLAARCKQVVVYQDGEFVAYRVEKIR